MASLKNVLPVGNVTLMFDKEKKTLATGLLVGLTKKYIEIHSLSSVKRTLFFFLSNQTIWCVCDGVY